MRMTMGAVNSVSSRVGSEWQAYYTGAYYTVLYEQGVKIPHIMVYPPLSWV
jgi:hypothetical protein